MLDADDRLPADSLGRLHDALAADPKAGFAYGRLRYFGAWSAEIDFPDFDPPTDLEVTDLVEGDGTEATSGSTVSVHYVGVAHSSGEEFDASYNRGTPLQFRLGIGQVISGWDTGVQGMKVGGRRRLVIPPHLGYGDRGAGGAIKPGETLIFVVDLLEVR